MGVAAPFDQQREQILHVEATSDAYHLTFTDGEDVMVAYLLEITHKEDDGEPSVSRRHTG